MARLIFKFGHFLMVSRRRKQVRSTVVFLFRAFLYVAAIILTVELVLISLSLAGITLPLPEHLSDLLTHLVL